MITRRQLLVAIGAAALSPAAFPQEQKVARIGFLGLRARSTPARPDEFYEAFLKGMRDLGYVEGRNLSIEWRFAEGRYERLPELARDLVRMNVEVIVAHGTPGTEAARQATRTIPIVTPAVADPVKSRFAASLAHPGGNVTGMVAFNVTPKYIDLLRALSPSLSRVAVLTNPANPIFASLVKDVEANGKSVGVSVLTVPARNAADIESGFASAAKVKVDAVIILFDPVFVGQRRQIAELAVKHRLPAIGVSRQFSEAGCLMSYGQNTVDNFRLAAGYVDKILKGAQPGDLPMEQPTKLELVVNLRTAQALKLRVPNEILLRADEVIR